MLLNCKYVDHFAEYGFAPTISRPTRITCHSATLIDHIFINQWHAITKSGIITASLSDHLATFTGILLDANRIGNKLKYDSDTCESSNRVINEKKIARFEEKMASIDWNFLHNVDGTNTKFDAFQTKYEEVYNECFPVTKKNQTIEKTLNLGY